MRFNWITIENFRSHAKTELAFERITTIRGDNAVGKSSIEEALGFLLAGRTLSTGANGQGMDRLIHVGTDKAVVTAELDGGIKMRASLTEKGGRNFQIKGGALPELPRDVWSCLCSTRYFFRLKPEDQRALIANLVVPADAEMPPEGLEVLGEAFKRGTSTLRDIDDAYKIAFEERTDLNRKIKDWREPEPVAADETTDTEAIKTQITQRQEELERERQKRREMLSDVTARDGKLADLNRRETEVTDSIEELRGEIAEQQRHVLSDEAVAEYGRAATKATERRRLEAERDATKAAVAALDTEVETISALDEQPSCPTCRQVIDSSIVEYILAPILQRRDEARQKLMDAQAAVDALPAAVDAGAQGLKLSEHHRALGLIERATKKLETQQAKIKKLDQERAAIGDPLVEPDTTAVDAAIANLERRVAKGWEMHRAATSAAQRKLAYEKAWEVRRELDMELAQLNRACEVLGPKGIRVKLLQRYVGAFAQGMHETLRAWGYSVDFSLDPYVLRLEQNKRQMDLDLLSESQQLRFGIAFQVALAAHLGIGFACIDRVDMLDKASRSILFNQLFEDERIEQAILLVTDDKVAAPDAPGTVFYGLSLDAKDDTAATEQHRTKTEAA